jgi:hypothetical protein
MPDGPRYDDDFYAWTRYQADVVRTRDNRFDREHLAEKIEDLGESERDAMRSQLRRVLVCCLQLAHSTTRYPRHNWMGSIVGVRARLADKLSPSLQRDIDEGLNRLYAAARKQAALELHEHGGCEADLSLPGECPYTIDQIPTDDWYPAHRDR